MTDIADAQAPAGPDRPAYLLPPEAYYDPAWYEHERRVLFERAWNLAAYEVDVPAPGDVLPVTVAGQALLLVRGDDGALRAFVNMCRHRGMALATEAQRDCATIRCAYHGWEFGLDGALARVPQRAAQFADLDPDRWGLVPVRLECWGGMVFVNPDGGADDLRTWLADLPDHMGPFPRTDLVELYRGRFPLGCNWKFYIENHIDCYHLWYLHDDSLKALDHHRLVARNCGDHWVCWEPLHAGETRDRPGMLPMRGMDEAEANLSRANLIFPNVPQTSGDRSFATYQVIPTGPETCVLDLRVWAEPGSELTDAARDAFIRILVTEDGFACEQMQRVVRSPHFRVGPLAAVHERPIGDLHRKLVAHLGMQGPGDPTVTPA